MNRFIWWIVKKLITLMWKRERFLVYSWGVDEHVDINVITEESYLDRHRFGLREEEIYKGQEPSEEKCPICKYPLSMCQCRFSGNAHPNRDKEARVVIDHIYLLTDAQIEHLKKVEEWWRISYDDDEMNQILKEMEQEHGTKNC